MSSITLIVTVHNTKGNCNSDNLLEIMKGVNPDVIFEEQSLPSHQAIYSGSKRDTLETMTIKRYLKNLDVKHIPVDTDSRSLMNKRLEELIFQLLNYFDQNPQIIRLVSERKHLAMHKGFPFLNSNQCDAITTEIHSIEQKLLRDFKDKIWEDVYIQWQNIHNQREVDMLKKIVEYYESNEFERGLFLVGAAHRKSIMDKVSNNKKLAHLNWDFNHFQNA